MKSYDVFMDSFVNVMLPDECDPDTQEGSEMIIDAATVEYMDRLRRNGDVDFRWVRFPEGDEPDPLSSGPDASLIAAAPELLAALRYATEFIKGSNECLDQVGTSDKDWVDYCVSLQATCDAAIAKAEGGE